MNDAEPRLTELEQEIAAARSLLQSLYAKRKELRAQAKLKRRSSCETQDLVLASARAGKTLAEIAEIINCKLETTTRHLYQAIWHAAEQQLLADGVTYPDPRLDETSGEWIFPEDFWDAHKRARIEINSQLAHGLPPRRI